MKNNSLQNRSIYHDLLRILATFAVICIHVCADTITWESKLYTSSTWEYLNIFDSISRFSVPVFVMLSGSFMLYKYENNSLKKLYSKNVLRLASAFVFWSVFYSAFDIMKNILFENSTAFKDLFIQSIQNSNHLWFLPMLIFLYVITPLLKEMCKTKHNEQYFILIALVPIIFNLVNYFITITPLENLFNNAGFQFVSGYTVYYILGHYLNKYDIHKKYRILIHISALISVVLTVLVSRWHYNSGLSGEPFFYSYLSPTVFNISLSVYLLFKYNFSKINFKERTQKFIVMLSSLTFGIYLSHMVFVKLFNQTPLTIENIHPLVSVPILVVAVFILSTFSTYIISKIPVLKKYII